MVITMTATPSETTISTIEKPRSSLPFTGLCRGDHDQRLELEKALLADPFDVHQVLDLLEAAVLLAVLDDSCRGGGPDARQRLQLQRGRRVEIERRAGRCRRR